MEQKLPIHKNAVRTPTPALFFEPPFTAPGLWGPLSFEPLWWNNDMLDTARRNVGRVLNNVFENGPASMFQPSADITEDRHALKIKMDVPGLEADDIDVSAEGDRLTISADKREEDENGEQRYSFSYSTLLPEGADISQADVRLTNHRLSVNIPKMNSAGKKLSVSRSKARRRKKTRH